MSLSPTLVLALILLVAFALMLSNRVRADVVAIGVALALGATGLISVNDVFAGFSRGAVITLIGLFMMTQGLYRTGVTQVLGRWLSHLSVGGERNLVANTMLGGAGLSLVMNNIAATAMMLPAVVDATHRNKVAPSKVMMPLAFATVLGGMATLFTTANIVASTVLKDAGLEGYGVFDFVLVGVPIAAAGLAYMLTIGRRLLPNTSVAQRLAHPGNPAELAEAFELQARLHEVRVPLNAALAGRTIEQSGIGATLGLAVIAIIRNERPLLAPAPSDTIRANDHLLVVGREERVRRLTEMGATVELLSPHDSDLVSDEVGLVEVILAPRSNAAGQTLKELRFRQKYGASVVALWHGGRSVRTDLADLPLQFGDSMLVHGTNDAIALLQSDADYLVLRVDKSEPLRRRRSRFALGIMVLAILISAVGWLPVPAAMMLGALLMVVTGCVTMDEAYRAVDWRAIFIVAGMIPVSIAMTNTGAAGALSSALVGALQPLGALAVAAGLLIVTVALTQVMSSQVTAIVMAPIAISAAQLIGVDPRSMTMYVALGCSVAFVTLTSHPVNVFVQGAGGYKPGDYTRVGVWLTLICVLVILIVTPLVWKF